MCEDMFAKGDLVAPIGAQHITKRTEATLKYHVTDEQVEMRAREGEKALALSALVDESISPAVRAAATAAAAEATLAANAATATVVAATS